MNTTTSVNKNSLFYLGLYQLLGGTIGLTLLFSTRYWHSNLLTWLILAIIAGGMLYSCICGLHCLKGKENALQLSLINQVIQLIGFSSLGFTISLMSCFSLSLAFDFNSPFSLGVNFGISRSQMSVNQDSPSTVWVEINLVACFLIYYIEKLKKKEKEAIAIAEADEIGVDIN